MVTAPPPCLTKSQRTLTIVSSAPFETRQQKLRFAVIDMPKLQNSEINLKRVNTQQRSMNMYSLLFIYY